MLFLIFLNLVLSQAEASNEGYCFNDAARSNFLYHITNIYEARVEMKMPEGLTEMYKCGRSIVTLKKDVSKDEIYITDKTNSLNMFLCRNVEEKDKIIAININSDYKVVSELATGKVISSEYKDDYATIKRGSLKGADGIAAPGIADRYECR